MRKNKLANKNVRAYIRKIIKNGDHREIINSEREKSSPKPKPEVVIAEEISSITDKRSAAKVLCRYYASGGSPPPAFDEIAEKYDLDTYDKLYNYGRELAGI